MEIVEAYGNISAYNGLGAHLCETPPARAGTIHRLCDYAIQGGCETGNTGICDRRGGPPMYLRSQGEQNE